MELGVQDVGEEGEEEEEGGHEERGGVEGVGELLPVPAQPLRQAEPEAHLQVRLLQPGGVDLRGRGASREIMMGEGNKQPLLCSLFTAIMSGRVRISGRELLSCAKQLAIIYSQLIFF